jgi:murein DD-endopeptidase MepM/ murein hydrolase activator NlpD
MHRYAVADGRIASRGPQGTYGNVVILEFMHRERRLYAAYCHLSLMPALAEDVVSRGDVIAYTGNTGNASTMRGEDQHLHFEIRTMPIPGADLANRFDPATFYGRAPIGWTFFEGLGQKVTSFGGRPGLKAVGINVR